METGNLHYYNGYTLLSIIVQISPRPEINATFQTIGVFDHFQMSKEYNLTTPIDLNVGLNGSFIISSNY